MSLRGTYLCSSIFSKITSLNSTQGNNTWLSVEWCRFPRLVPFIFNPRFASKLPTIVLPIKNCRRFIDGVQTFYSFALPMSTHLFFFRIQAVFNDSRPAVYFFLLLRVVVCSGAILQATGAQAAHIGPTMDCMLIDLHTYCAMGTLAVAFNDTLVVFAISTRLT